MACTPWEVQVRLHPMVKPPTRAGFGRVVSDQMLTAALAATVRTSFEPAGIQWVLDLPETEFTLPG